ncbi:MAG: tyrosine-type recombinase/integrase [Bacteroidetes bacterium]|nr:tyrosine-type recombinase/integrase [Bacteroidota bacterium]
MKSDSLAYHLTNFFNEYLPSQRNASANTIKTYRDAFVLFLRFCRDRKRWRLDKIQLHSINAQVILEFLETLQTERCCSVATRNQRLIALHVFFRYVQTEIPELLTQCQRILAIPSSRCNRAPLHYLSLQDIAALLEQPNRSHPSGRRDCVLLSVLYDTAARVQEIINLLTKDIRLDSPAQVRLLGKGRKIRIVPLMSNTVNLLTGHMRERNLFEPHRGDEPLFVNRSGGRLSRSGVRHILLKYAEKAGLLTADERRSVSPHMIRHSRAMHLLEAGTPIVVIRDLLGHVDVKTTEIYARANLEMKRQALEKLEPLSPDHLLEPIPPRWQTDKNLLDWLRAL